MKKKKNNYIRQTLTEDERANIRLDPSLRRLASRSPRGLAETRNELRRRSSLGRARTWILDHVPGAEMAVSRRVNGVVHYDAWE